MNRKSQGVTLIEVLAVLGILVLISAMAIPALSLFRSQTALKHSARAVQSLMQQARTMAIAQGKEFTVRINPAEGSAVILDGTAEASKKWLAPAAVEITDVSGNPATFDLVFKPDGGAKNNISVHMKRRDALASDATKYYTITIVNNTGTARIYPTKQN